MEQLTKPIEVAIKIETNKDTYERIFDNIETASLCLREINNAQSLEEQIDMLSNDYEE